MKNQKEEEARDLRMLELSKKLVPERLGLLDDVDKKLGSEKEKIVELLKAEYDDYTRGLVEEKFSQAREQIINSMYGEGMVEYGFVEMGQLLKYSKTDADKTYNLVHIHGQQPFQAVKDRMLLKYKGEKARERIKKKLQIVDAIVKASKFDRAIDHACAGVCADLLLTNNIVNGSGFDKKYVKAFRKAKNILLKHLKTMLYTLINSENKHEPEKIDKYLGFCTDRDIILYYADQYYRIKEETRQKAKNAESILQTDFSEFLKEVMFKFNVPLFAKNNKIEEKSSEFRKLKSAFYRLHKEAMETLLFVIITNNKFTLKDLSLLAKFPGSGLMKMIVYNTLGNYVNIELEKVYASFGLEDQFCRT